jgi:formimidoylglutamate deiminase
VIEEAGWLPDLLYTPYGFESGVALFTDKNGTVTRLSRDPLDLERATRLRNRAILPGLVNVHSHAFQRVIRGRTEHRTAERDTFWTWRVSMYHAANRVSKDAMLPVARMAFCEMALSGITTVGEFHYVHHDAGGVPYPDRNVLAKQILRAASDVGIRIALLRTAYVRAGWKKDPDPGQARFITPRVEDFISDTEELRKTAGPCASVGVAPHSVRAVPLDYLRQVHSYAVSKDLPLHMHVSEQPGEIEACVGEYGLRPIELLHREGILGDRFTGIHAIHITQEEAGMLGGSTVCACPTSERNLGDGAVPADRLYDAGARICFGSDSNVQIDILEDARLLEYHLRMNRLERVVLSKGRDLSERLFRSATESGAASLRVNAGVLESGRAADFIAVDLNDFSLAGADRESLLDHVVFSMERTAVRDVWVDGRQIVRDGRHAMQDEIVAEFGEVQRSLW